MGVALKQHYMIEFLSDNSKTDSKYFGQIQLHINEVLKVGDIFSFFNQDEYHKELIKDFGTSLFKIIQREFWMADEVLREEPENSCILLTLTSYFENK